MAELDEISRVQSHFQPRARRAIPIRVPEHTRAWLMTFEKEGQFYKKQYSLSEAEAVIEGGTAEELAVQVVSALVKSLKLSQTVVSSLWHIRRMANTRPRSSYKD